MPVVLYFDGHVRDPAQPVGLDIATDQFLDAFIRHTRQDRLACITANDRDFEYFKERVAALGIDAARCERITPGDAPAIAAAGCLFRYTPDIIADVWSRRHAGQRDYSVAGLSHTGSTDTVMDIAGAYVTAPTQSWDALICPSAAIRSVYRHAITGWSAYLAERMGADAACPMQFPVIPLGVDAAGFAALAAPEKRARQRQQLGLADGEVAILFVGRLSHYAKANPLPLLLGAEQAALRTGKQVHLVMLGYFPDHTTETAFQAASAAICATARVTFVATDDAAFGDGFWAGADIFCSLSDNIQESFGLTPIEAMAAGLPVVVSDWDGYRETVRDGIDGFTIPTLLPAAGFGPDLAYRYFAGEDTYGAYLAAAAQATAVDSDATIDRLTQLVDDPDLRKRMGDAGRARVQATYDWPHIIAAYEELWDDLAERRAKDSESAPPAGPSFHPLRPDPFALFADFASRRMAGDGVLELALENWDEALKRLGLATSLINPETLVALDDLPIIIAFLESQAEPTIDAVCAALPQLDALRLVRTLAWLVKLGICRYRGK